MKIQLENNMNDMNRYAIQQNNIGVNRFVICGDLATALHHFRQALAAKLATEKRLLTSSEKNGPLQSTDSSAEDNPTGDIEIIQMQDFTPNEACNMSYDQFEACSYRYDTSVVVPYLYCRPFTLIDAGKDVGSTSSTLDLTITDSETNFASTESTVTSLTIIFNLALMHHMSDHTSRKAHALYQIAATLQSSLPMPTDSESLLLHVAVLNNYGVWCFHNHDGASTKACFEEMEYMIDEATWSSDDDVTLKIHETTRNGFVRNLRMCQNNSMH